MSLSPIHLPVKYWLKHWSPMQDLPQSLTPSSYSYPWSLDNQPSSALFLCKRRNDFSSDLWTLVWTSISDDRLCPSDWNSVSYHQHLCWCTIGRRQLVLPPYFIIHKSSWHITIVKYLFTIDQSSDEVLVPRWCQLLDLKYYVNTQTKILAI